MFGAGGPVSERFRALLCRVNLSVIIAASGLSRHENKQNKKQKKLNIGENPAVVSDGPSQRWPHRGGRKPRSPIVSGMRRRSVIEGQMKRRGRRARGR